MTNPSDADAAFDVRAPRPIRRVLVGVSLEPEEGAVLSAAAAVARTTGASLTVVHAAEPPVDAWAFTMPAASLEDLRSRLADEVRRLAAPAQEPCEISVAYGAAHRVLDEAAQRVSPDLIVVGATVRRGAALLGSTAERVVRKATVPVLVVRGPLEIPPRRVVAPVDLSALSADGFHCGLALVSRLAGGEQVEVVALFAIGYLDPMAREMREQRWSVDEMTKLARNRLEGLVEEHRPTAPLRVESKVVLGPAREEILGEAKQADLVVMSTHGHGGFEKLVLGSVASTVVREAPCSVLLVPPEAAFGDAIAEAVLSQTAPCKTASV